ncbi:MAG TPA: right-handed parallel beta-helix repeat-containing protein [Gemmataceae bacterium]|nr:right-handed parallel beta-helix repeat-containing protein [Gemmataceae bacterium]
MKAELDPRRYRRRLQLERLEDRTLLSTFTVDRLTDAGQGTGLTGDLRYCISQALSGQDTIAFGVTGTINLTKALPDLSKSVTIAGPGANLLTVRRDSGGSYRIFSVDGGATVTISSLTIANGIGPQPLQVGGGIANSGTLTLNNSTLTGNSAFEGGGGGIFNSASAMLTVNNSTLSGNSSGDGVGGGIRNDGTLLINGSTFTNNSATVGGAIQNTGALMVNTCTLSSNSANEGGGLDNNSGSLTVDNSTLSGNVASSGGGGAILSVLGAPGTVLVNGSIFSGNSAASFGSAIDCSGTLTVNNSTLSSNQPLAPAVGTIYIGAGTAALSNSIVSANSSVGGGGIFVNGGTLTINNSTISGNSGRDPQAGGGICNNGTLTILGSTISGNSVYNPDSAGGIFNRGNLTISNSTISGNSNTFSGTGGTTAAGGIADLALSTQDATVLLLNSTLANNTANMTSQTGSQLVAGHLGTGTTKATAIFRNTIFSSDGRRPNFFALSGGTFFSQGHNLSSDNAAGFLTGSADLVNAKPLLGPLQDNGGPTQTIALLPGSPAVDAGDNSNVPAFDQRGPGFARIVGGIVDIGAFEVQPGPATQLQLSAPAHVTAGVPFSITVTALDAYGHTATGYLGTVILSSTDTDPGVVLPVNYGFTAADSGVHLFSNAVKLRTAGNQSITATDMLAPSISGSVAVTVGLPIFSVTTTLDSGPGSLRQALLDADATPGPDTIRFAIGTGVQTINLAAPLPAITQPTIIDGTSQPGYAGAPLIELNGAGAGAGADGLFIMAGGSVVRDLVINRFALSGIDVQTGGGNILQGNYIGTDVTGTLALGNGLGVRLATSNNTIGGTAAAAGNVIAGNGGDGIFISSGTANVVQGNFIGTDGTGMANLGNLNTGVHLLNASGNTIGGTANGAANVIGFNGYDGVLVDGGSGNAIQHNAIFGHSNGLGIELLDGGNNRLPFPILTNATSDGSTLMIQGLLQSLPNTTLTLEFFANAVCNPSGFGEGQQFLGSSTVTTNGHGTASFTVLFANAVPVGPFIATTATDSDGNTSAFSNCVLVTMPPVPPMPAAGNHERLIDATVILGAEAPQGVFPPWEPDPAAARPRSFLQESHQPLVEWSLATVVGDFVDELIASDLAELDLKGYRVRSDS